MALGLTYLRAIETAGGLPVVMPPLEIHAIEPLLRQMAGVCLSGGPDLDPESYEDPERHPELGPTEPDLDLFELAVAREAERRGLPLLAICRGCQALNVSRGGTLHPHLPDLAGSTVDHRQSEPGDRPTHGVDIEAGSLLSRVMGTTHAEVNSFHHQAPLRVGKGLRAVAWAPDGVIEGIEAPDGDFVLGVQWHAEGIFHQPEQAALFKAFVEAARRLRSPEAGARAA